MNDIDKAKEILYSNSDYTCVLCKGENVFASTDKGISPMMKFIGNEIDLQGFSAADRIVGKAVAMLFVFAGIKAVYAQVISQKGLDFLHKNNIEVSYGEITESIINRAKTGLCPMEITVEEINEPFEAYNAISKTLERLRKE